MPISWNEIRHRAYEFSKEWSDESRENPEAKSFWDHFFSVFGIKRRTVASFEEPVRKLSGSWGYIDLFWPGTLLVEHKSRGKSLDRANSQAMEYIRSLKDAGRDEEIPRYVVVSDFARLTLHDLDEDISHCFDLEDFHKHIHAFAFIPGYKQAKLEAEDPINIKAVERLGDLHDALEEGGYSGHELERLLVRILFCLFADDTGIFERNTFNLYIENHTREDGSDLGIHLERFFQVLDTPEGPSRQKHLVEELADLPFVNGHLFSERLSFAEFNRSMRDQLLRCMRFDWSEISPGVFGSLFQSVMEPKERRRVGAHYTSERDVLKVVKSLFLDEMREEFENIKSNKNRLRDFHAKLSRLRFLDPACGCGSFLVVTYRELRLLELDVLKAIHGDQRVMDIRDLSKVDVDAMFGIECDEFPARIAEVAMWLVDHQMNQLLSSAFGLYFVRLPLEKSATIRLANALRIDWNEVLPARACSFVLGNPPFVGSKYQDPRQRADMKLVIKGVKGAGVLDYVTAWYFKAASYIKGNDVKVGFVSTNSISQGEQVGILWSELFKKHVKIIFCHRTFRWQSEARGKAHVHVVIVGFSMVDVEKKIIVDYESSPDSPTTTIVRRISPYLIEGVEAAITKRSKPVSDVPRIAFGSMPNDDGYLLLDDKEKNEFLQVEPDAAKFVRRMMGAVEFINDTPRWCLWLVDALPGELRALPEVMKRIEKVRRVRLESKRRATNRLAATPSLFGEIRQPNGRFLAIPKTSSQFRRYIPLAFLEPNVIAGSELFTCAHAGMYHFAVLSSSMHMAWVRLVCGRMKSDYRYSARLVYNNFPWPSNPTDRQKTRAEDAAQTVLDVRAKFPGSTLAVLYDPLTMPAELSKAHAALDRAVELCYRSAPFDSDRKRVEHLFDLYDRIVAPLAAAARKPKSKPSRSKKGSAEA